MTIHASIPINKLISLNSNWSEARRLSLSLSLSFRTLIIVSYTYFLSVFPRTTASPHLRIDYVCLALIGIITFSTVGIFASAQETRISSVGILIWWAFNFEYGRTVGSNSGAWCWSKLLLAFMPSTVATEIRTNNFFSHLSRTLDARKPMNDSYIRSKGTLICSLITVNTSTNLDYLVYFFSSRIRHSGLLLCLSIIYFFFLSPKLT